MEEEDGRLEITVDDDTADLEQQEDSDIVDKSTITMKIFPVI